MSTVAQLLARIEDRELAAELARAIERESAVVVDRVRLVIDHPGSGSPPEVGDWEPEHRWYSLLQDAAPRLETSGLIRVRLEWERGGSLHVPRPDLMPRSEGGAYEWFGPLPALQNLSGRRLRFDREEAGHD